MSLSTVLCSWYPLGLSKDVKKGGAITVDVLGHALVVFRTKKGELGVLSRHCPHMGGDLSRGQVSENGVVCPIHHWEFDTQGALLIASNSKAVHSPACQASVSCLERWGLIFAFFGEEPYFDFPNTEGEVFCAAPILSDKDMNYTVPSLFGFDSEHFKTVHHRDLTEMTIYRYSEGHIGTRLVAAIGVTRWSDRLMCWLGVKEVKNDIDYWAGNIVFGSHEKTKTHVLITTLPLAENRSRVFVVVLQEKPSGNWIKQCLGWCRFQISIPLIQAFVRQDEVALDGVRFNASTSKHRSDNQITEWLEHVKRLPEISTSEILK